MVEIGDLEGVAALPAARCVTARALLLGERIDTAGLERADLVSTSPLAFPAGQSGFVVLYRFGVAVLFGLSPLEEDEIVTKVGARVAGRRRAATTRPWCSRSRPKATTSRLPTGASPSRTSPASACW